MKTLSFEAILLAGNKSIFHLQCTKFPPMSCHLFVTHWSDTQKPTDFIKTEDYKVIKCSVETRHGLDVFIRGLSLF